MAKKKHRLGCTLLAIPVVVLVAVIACQDSSTRKASQPSGGGAKQEKPKPAPSAPALVRSEFDQVGYFKTDKLRGFTFYVKNPNKQDIQAFCAEKKRLYATGRILMIHFFDNREHTPDVTLKYYFPESSDKYLVADYFHNPFNGEQGLKFHKDIPEKPKEAK